MEEDNVPEDLEVKLGSKREAQFDRILRAQEEAILVGTVNVELAEVVKAFCEKRIKEEQDAR